MTKNNHIYFILQFDPLKHSNHNSSCNLTYTPQNHIKLHQLGAKIDSIGSISSILYDGNKPPH